MPTAPRPWLPPLDEPAADAARMRSEVEAARARLEGADIAVTLEVLEGLARCPIPEAGELAAPYMTRKFVSRRAIDVVARSGMAGARELVEPLLTHRLGDTRSRAASALGLIGDPEALPALKRLLETEADEPLVQRWAAVAIAELGGAAEAPYLEAQRARVLGPAATHGVDIALDLLGAEDPPPTADEIVAWLDAWSHPRRGLPARTFLFAMPAASLADVVPHLDGPALRRFAAADLLSVRGHAAALPAVEALTTAYDPLLVTAGYAAVARLGGDASEFGARWASFEPRERAQEARRATFLSDPVPEPLLEAFVADPCALVAAVGAGFIRRDPTPAGQGIVVDALSTERARLNGEVPRRAPEANDMLKQSSLAAVVDGDASWWRALPGTLPKPVEELLYDELTGPEVLAAHALLHALAAFDAPVARKHLKPWLDAASPLLRLDALSLWVQTQGARPDQDFGEDPHPLVQRMWRLSA